MSNNEVFNILNNVDINPLTKEKGKFWYLSWSNAVREASKLFPSMTWEMTKWDSLPFLKTDIGYFVECSVNINGLIKTQMMPVLDFRNNTMMDPSGSDINKCQMRALTKAIALHGLGIDLWAGEDINGEYEGDGSKKIQLTIDDDQINELVALLCDSDGNYTAKGNKVRRAFTFENICEILMKDFKRVVEVAKS